jgi:hypothetical protein
MAAGNSTQNGWGVGLSFNFRPMRGVRPHLFPSASVRQGRVILCKAGRKKDVCGWNEGSGFPDLVADNEQASSS